MKILYKPESEFVVAVNTVAEPRTVIRVAECLIKEFESDSDCSFLQAVLETARIEANHTLN